MLDPPASNWVEEARPPASFIHPAPTLTILSSVWRLSRPATTIESVPNETRYEVNKPDVVDESVDGEVLIVHLGTGNYYSARGSAEAIWQMLAAGSTPAEVAASINGGASPADAHAAVEAYVASLEAEELIRHRRTPPVEVAASVPSPFVAPELEKFTDMQQLLLLDPIHDVDDQTGWPAVKPASA